MKTIATLKCFITLLFTGAFLLACNDTSAVTNTYNSSGNYSTTGNWSLGHVPLAGEDIVINANCTISSAVTTPLLNSVTVNAGKTLGFSSNSTINITTLTVYGTLSNTTANTIIINAVNVALDATTGAGDIELGSNSSSSTTINITGNLTGVSGGYIHHTTGGSTGIVNFNGSNVIQTWSDATTFADKVNFNVNGTHNSLQLLTAATLSPKSTVTVSSGDTLDCQTFSLSSMTNAAGGVTISSGAAIKIGNTSGLNGNVSTANGGNSFSSGGTYIFSGSTNQVTGTELPSSIANLTIRNTGSAGSNIVSTSQAINVTGIFTLGGGLLSTSSTNLLTLTATASSTNGTTASYVEGPMAKTGNTVFVFPIGKSSRFMPLGISAPATITNTITSEYFFATPTNPYSVNAPLISASLLEYWIMTETVTANSIDVILNWQNGPKSGIYTYTTAALHVADYTGGAWHDLGASAVSGTYPGAGSVTANSTITNFSSLPITFGSINSTNPLPITLSSFNATYMEESKSVLINFVVASQLNNKEFVIEKTEDGINYIEVATIAGEGTTPFSNSYSAYDPSPSEGISYYRLKQIDVDGNATEFAPVPVYINTKQNSNIILYPNPGNDLTNLNYISEDGEPITICITDMTGRTLCCKTYSDVKKGENNFPINTSGLSSGVYFMKINSPQKSNCLKFIKQ